MARLTIRADLNWGPAESALAYVTATPRRTVADFDVMLLGCSPQADALRDNEASAFRVAAVLSDGWAHQPRNNRALAWLMD